MKNRIRRLFPPYELPAEAATAIIQDHNGRYLLLKRSLSSKTYQLFWQLPEGKVAKGESPSKALKRELKEELGNVYKDKEIKFIRKQRIIARFLGLPLYYVDRHLFICPPPEQINLSHEHLNYDYFTKDRIKKLRNKLPGLLDLIKTKKLDIGVVNFLCSVPGPVLRY